MITPDDHVAHTNRMAADLHSALERAGGGTLDPTTGLPAQLRQGFLVSIRRYERRFFHWPTIEQIANWLSEVAYAWADAPGRLFPGIWYDRQALSVYCDLNVLVVDQVLAMELGQRERQLSIRDNRLGTNIPVQPLRRAA